MKRGYMVAPGAAVAPENKKLRGNKKLLGLKRSGSEIDTNSADKSCCEGQKKQSPTKKTRSSKVLQTRPNPMRSVEIFKQLEAINFDSDDSSNPKTWAKNDQIDRYINQAILNQDGSIAYYIGPTNYAFDSNERIEDMAHHICRRRNSDGEPLNDFYGSKTMDKPFIVIANTVTTLAKSSTDVDHTGGLHWVGWVLLPKQYKNLRGEEKGIGKYQIFFFDSLGRRHFPDQLKFLLTQGGNITADKTTITLLPFCKPDEIIFTDCHATGQQTGMNGADCGWWATYYVLMTVYTGSVAFLEPLRDKTLSAVPLRSVMALEETVPPRSSSLPLTRQRLPHHSAHLWQPSRIAEPSLQGSGAYRASGLKRAQHGNIYQLKLLMLFLKRGVDKGYSFWLATEMDDAEKFDDVVFCFNAGTPSNPVKKYRFLQAKHKHVDSEKILVSDLLKGEKEKENNFSLQKYFISFVKLSRKVPREKIEDVILCTNSNFDFARFNFDAKDSPFREIKKEDFIFNIDGGRKAVRYQLDKQHSWTKKHVYPTLRKTSESKLLAKELVSFLFSGKKVTLGNNFFKKYHVALVKAEVINLKTKKLCQCFIAGRKRLTNGRFKDLAPEILAFRREFLEAARQYYSANTERGIWQQVGKEAFDLAGSIGCSKPNNDEADVLPQDQVLDKDIEDFLDKLVFAVNQPNEKELGNIITREISNSFDLVSDTFIASEFQKEMLDWMKVYNQQESPFLSVVDGKRFFVEAEKKLGRLIMIGPSLAYQRQLKETKLVFTVMGELDGFLSAKQQILSLVAPQSTYLTAIKVCQVLKSKAAYEPQDACLFQDIRSCLRLEDKLTQAYSVKASGHLLVIECNEEAAVEDINKLFHSLHAILVKNPDKKIILITDGEHQLDCFFANGAGGNYRKIRDQKQKFSDLDATTQKQMRSRTVFFQGKKYPLAEIVAEDVLPTIIEEEDFLRLTGEDDFILANASPQLNDFERGCYISRQFERTITLKPDCLQAPIPDIFVISDITEQELAKHIPKQEKVSTFTPEKHPPVRFIVLSADTDANAAFRQIVEHYEKKNIHRIVRENGEFVWQESYGSVAHVRQYISEDRVTQQKQLMERISIIAAEPGMGKSVFMTQCALDTQQDNNKQWVVSINLSTWREQLSKAELNSIMAVMDFLAEILHLTGFAKKVFNYCCQQPGRVRLFFDGFDELNVQAQERLTGLLKRLQVFTVVEIVVTTRLHMREVLENELSTLSYTLKALDQTDQAIFLRKFWMSHVDPDDADDVEEKLDVYIQALLTLFSESIDDSDRKFLGIPLQARMLAEAFKEDVLIYIRSNNTEPNLPETLNLLELYQRFVTEKYHLYFTDKVPLNSFTEEIFRTTLVDFLTKSHRFLAFQSLFPEDANTLNIVNKTVVNSADLKRVGMVQSGGAEIAFTHRTFAEYFVADLFISMLKKPRDSLKYKKFWPFIIRQIFKDRNEVVRGFLERRVTQEGDEKLQGEWKRICTCNLMRGHDSSRGGSLIVEYSTQVTIEKEKAENSQDAAQRQFDYAFEKVQSLPNCLDYNEGVRAIDALVAVTRKCRGVRETLEKALQVLSALAHRTNFNKIKDYVLEHVSDVIEDYVRSCFAQCELGQDLAIDYNLLASFGTIKSFSAPSPYSHIYEGSVDCLSQQSRQKTQLYKQLNVIRKKPPRMNETLLRNLSPALILFLRVKNVRFTTVGFNVLAEYFECRKQDDHFVSLLLQVGESAAQLAKQFFIQQQGWQWLEKLFEKNQQLTLNQDDIEKIYLDKDLFWLERAGIRLCLSSRTLNEQLLDRFKAVLQQSPINGCHTGYANNIFNQLILPLLDLQKEPDELPGIKICVLIKMITTFIEFSMTHRCSHFLDSTQLQTILNLIETLLNQSNISVDLLSGGIHCLMTVVEAAGLTIVDTGQTLLVLHSTDEFAYDLQLNHKENVSQLIASRLNETEDGFNAACRRATFKLAACDDTFFYSATLGLFPQRRFVAPEQGASRSFEAPF